DPVLPDLGALAVVADRVVPPGVLGPEVDVVTPGGGSVVDESADGAVVPVESDPGGSSPVCGFLPLCPQAAATSPAATSAPSNRNRRRPWPAIGATLAVTFRPKTALPTMVSASHQAGGTSYFRTNRSILPFST